MQGRGLFSNFVSTMFDFYGGMFRLTFFLPFVLLQVKIKFHLKVSQINLFKAWYLSRRKFLEHFDEDYVFTFDEPDSFKEKTTKITWDKDAVPGQSILKKKKSNEKEPSSPIDKLIKIEKDIEIISDILLSREDAEIRTNKVPKRNRKKHYYKNTF